MIVSFDIIDENGNGTLDRKEVRKAFLALHKAIGVLESIPESNSYKYSEKDFENKVDEFVDQLFKDFDYNKDDVLSFEEFHQAVIKSKVMKELEEKLTLRENKNKK